MRRSLPVAILIFAAGCASEDPLSDPNNPLFIDAGFLRVDAGFRDAAQPDSGVPRDSGVGPRDTGPADTGGPPPCTCPALPSSCTPPLADTPAFAPGDDSMLSQLFGVFACSEDRLRIAMYETDSECVVGAILSRLNADPDLRVDIVIDDDQCPMVNGARGCALAEIERHPRVTILEDMRSRYMHHKFVIADDRWVWAGSANFTERSFCDEANDAIVIEDPVIVGAFEEQFDRLFVQNAFGPKPASTATVSTSYAVYFSPESPITDGSTWFYDLLFYVDTASTSIDFAIAAFTRPEISDALIAAHNRGVRVRGIVSYQYAEDIPALALIAAGVPLKVGRVHHKLMIVDEIAVITGSPNWSEAAWANNEDSLWIEDPAIAIDYVDWFERLYMRSMDP